VADTNFVHKFGLIAGRQLGDCDQVSASQRACLGDGIARRQAYPPCVADPVWMVQCRMLAKSGGRITELTAKDERMRGMQGRIHQMRQ
jgi:hypothetical protein